MTLEDVTLVTVTDARRHSFLCRLGLASGTVAVLLQPDSFTGSENMDHGSILRKCCKISANLLLILIPFVGPVTAQTGDTANGQKIFMDKCKKCHGEDGSANTNFGKSLRASDLRSADVQKKTDADFYTQIEKGKKNMPSFGGSLSKTEINDVIAYVRVIGKKQSGAK